MCDCQPPTDSLPAPGVPESCSNGHVGVDVCEGLLALSRQDNGRLQALPDCGHELGGLGEGKIRKGHQLTAVQPLSIEHLPCTMRIQPESVFQAEGTLCAKALR